MQRIRHRKSKRRIGRSRRVIDLSRYRTRTARRRLVARRMRRQDRHPIDRRSGEDRRVSYSLDYFNNGGVERRRSGRDRRQSIERRRGWVRVTDWSSVYVGVDEEKDVKD